MKRRENLVITIPNGGTLRHALLRMPYSKTGQEIVDKAASAGGLSYGGCGEQTAVDGALIEVKLDFFFSDLASATESIRKVGVEMGFPEGTTLTHVIFNPEDASFVFNTLATW